MIVLFLAAWHIRLGLILITKRYNREATFTLTLTIHITNEHFGAEVLKNREPFQMMHSESLLIASILSDSMLVDDKNLRLLT